MKKQLMVIGLLALTGIGYSQSAWTGTNTTGNAYRTGNVGIGTTSPAFALDISTSSSTSGFRLTQTGSGSAILQLNNTTTGGRNWSILSLGNGDGPSAGHFGVWDMTASANRFFISGTNGNVGINTTGPANKLDMVVTAADDGYRVTQTTLGSSALILNNTTSGGKSWSINSLGQGNNHGTGNLSIYDGTANSRFFISGSGTSIGYVGIGTTTPAQKLDVAGNINTSGILTIGSAYTLDGTAGSFKNAGWAGTGNRILLSDATGKVTPLAQGGSTQVLYGTGTWGNLPAGSFVDNGTSVTLPAGKNLGIGTATPVSALDVTGDANFRGAVNATQGLTYDTYGTVMETSRGTGAGAFPVTSIGSSHSSNPHFGDTPDYPAVSCLNDPVTSALPTNGFVGTNNNGLFASSNGVTSSNTHFAFLTAFVNKNNANGYLDLGGSFDGTSNNNALFINSQCRRNLMVFGASQFSAITGNVMSVEGYVNLAKNLQIGVTGASSFTDLTSQLYVRAVAMQYGANILHGGGGGAGLKIRELDDTEKAISVFKGTQTADVAERFSVRTDGKTEISTINTDALVLRDANNSNVINFNTKASGQTFLGNVTQTNNSMLTVGQSNKNAPAFVLTDNTNSTNQDYFTVQGNGYTEIKVYSPTNMPSPSSNGYGRVFAIKDMAATKDIFVVRSDGKTYAREVEISLVTTFPDYVFNKDYKLKSINEVSEFIAANKHLPGFEKGEYYEKNGINVNNMLVKQQEKMEEMMLYIIELEKRLKNIESQK